MLSAGRRLRRPTVAVVAALTMGLALTALPGAHAMTSDSQARDHRMYTIAVRATDGNAPGLAQRLIARGYDLLEARSGSVLYVLGSSATANRLAAVSGASVVGRVPAAPTGPIPKAPASQDSVLPSRLDGKTYPTFYGGYRTTKGFYQFENDIQDAYPNLMRLYTFGSTFTGKNKLNVMCVTANAKQGCQLKPNVDKPRFLLMAQIHAREIATSETTWRYLSLLADGYKKDAQITSLLNSSEIWVVPQYNVDGIQLVEKGLESDGTGSDSTAWTRKNHDYRQAPEGGCPPPWSSSQPGVDLNRNFDTHWDTAGVSHYPCSEVFNGKKAGSETEVKKLDDLFRTIFKDQRDSGDDAAAPANTTGAMVTLHTVAGLVLFPWGANALGHTPNDAGMRSLGFRQSYFNQYDTGQPFEVLYEVSGTTDDWAYDDLGIASYTWELDGVGAGCQGTFFPLYSCMDDYWNRNRPGLVYDAAAARMPYKLGLGPTITSVKAKLDRPNVVVKLTADDGAYGASGVGRPAAQNVKAARIYVGTAPWDGGKPADMKIKGKGTEVTATATVEPGAKKVLAYVQAQDADKNWGPVWAVWIPAA